MKSNIKCLPILALLFLSAFPGLASARSFENLSGSPGLRSASAIVMDESGKVIYGKDAGTVRPIASITKLMTAIVILDSGLDLDEKIEVTRDDRDLIKLTGSRLQFGARLSRREMLKLAVMASENRAAAALGRTYPGGTSAMVQQMNIRAVEIGMTNTRFADPVGLNAENVSTAKDLATLVAKARTYPLIVEASTTTRLTVHPWKDRGPLVYGNTNRLLKNQTWDIRVSKTGYINEAGRCLVMQAIIDGVILNIVFLDSFGKLTPFGDSNRLRRWLLGSNP
ncbi:MAG TPA: serine hydrolase [Xanthomonadales bacterium]|nr:serine hydrolase [Xanthomonadales bacterium]